MDAVSDLAEYVLDGRNTGSANTEAIFAWGDAEQVSHTSFAGDVNSGKAWEAIRHPFDMVHLMFILSTEYTNGSKPSMLSRLKSTSVQKNQERHTSFLQVGHTSHLEENICMM
jgi:hypothetical protein